MMALTGWDLRRMAAASVSALERNADAINALNVYPVPDGDTGINMLLTLRSLHEAGEQAPGSGIGEVASAMARGALLGARGNAGVILSQFFRGLARALDGRQEASPGDLAVALAEGARAAYKAVSQPAEGTILTVGRAAAEAAQRAAARDGCDLVEVLEAGLRAAQTALAQTPDLLPVLKEAGVVDAGGQGLVILWEAFLRTLRGEGVEDIRVAPSAAPMGRVREEFLRAVEEEEYGYCTSFLLLGERLDPEAVRERLGALGGSLVVVGDERAVKVHIHAPDPGPVLSYAVSQGSLSQVKIDNIDEQHREFEARHRREVAVGVVAVASGKGLEEVFRSLGALVLQGGQSMNPSCEQILGAVNSLRARTAIVLPNNPNIIPTAQQAASLSPTPVTVIPTRSIPQGVAAMVAFSPEREAEANRQDMEEAAGAVRTGEVVTSVREARVGGQTVWEGEVMGLLEGELAACGRDPLAVLLDLVGKASPASGSLITLYWGGETTEWEAQEAARRLREAFAGVEVEVVYGGQPFYHYILALE